MEILFMVFMVVVSVMALFAVMVVFRDIVKEILAARKERDAANRNVVREAERIIDEAPVVAAVAVEAENTVETVAEPVAEHVEEPVAEPVAEEETAPTEEAVEDEEGKISFSTNQRQTLEEKYLALPTEARGWYDEIIKYASNVEGSKRIKNVRYEEYKVGQARLVRMLIKRGIIHCEFILHNSDFKNYVNENKISVRQAATTMRVENEAGVQAAKSSIDIVVAAIAEEKEYKKQQARERRRAARAANKENAGASEE